MKIKPSALIYDLESYRPIAEKPKPGKPHQPRVPGIEYAASWTTYHQIGVSVIVTFNTATGQCFKFTYDQMHLLNDYLETVQVDYFVGMNNINFDDNVLRHTLLNQSAYVHDENVLTPPPGYGPCVNIRPEISRYDIQIEMKIADKYAPNAFVKGFGLDNAAMVHGFGNKIMDGALAPIYWQQNEPGMREQVERYCFDDVNKTAQLWHLIVETGKLKNPRITHGPVARMELQMRPVSVEVEL